MCGINIPPPKQRPYIKVPFPKYLAKGKRLIAKLLFHISFCPHCTPTRLFYQCLLSPCFYSHTQIQSSMTLCPTPSSGQDIFSSPVSAPVGEESPPLPLPGCSLSKVCTCCETLRASKLQGSQGDSQLDHPGLGCNSKERNPLASVRL